MNKEDVWIMLIQKLKYAPNLTAQEQIIVDFIVEQPETVFEVTAHQLAKLTYTSSSTVVRLCKKLGFKGYPDFQLKLALDGRKSNEHSLSQSRISANRCEELEEAIEDIAYLYQQAVLQTRQIFKKERLSATLEWVKGAERIDIYGGDANYYIAQQASAKWNELGLITSAHNGINHHYLRGIANKQSVISFIISHTGNNTAMLDAAQVLKQLEMKTIAVTGRPGSALDRLCDETIQTYVYRDKMRLSKATAMISAMYIFDVLYTSMISDEEG